MLELAVGAIAAFGGSLGLVPICRTVATRLGFVASPRDDRWHRRPTALLGGVGIALPVLLAGASAMLVVGLADDLLTLKPYSKLVGEIAIASLFVFFGYRLSWSASLTFDTLLTLVWIV